MNRMFFCIICLQIANSFIMCGILYGVRDGKKLKSRIDMAYDLYEDRFLDNFDVTWYNPYELNTMLDYNPYDKRLYFNDNQNFLSTSVGVKSY